MSDKRPIAERLLLCESSAAIRATSGPDIEIGPLCREAADEIERLRTENEMLRKEIAVWRPNTPFVGPGFEPLKNWEAEQLEAYVSRIDAELQRRQDRQNDQIVRLQDALRQIAAEWDGYPDDPIIYETAYNECVRIAKQALQTKNPNTCSHGAALWARCISCEEEQTEKSSG